MKNLILLIVVFFLNGVTEGIQAKEKVKYCYAYSCDGFNQDRDEIRDYFMKKEH